MKTLLLNLSISICVFASILALSQNASAQVSFSNSALSIPLQGVAYGVTCADFNSDGKIDIAVTSIGTNKVIVYLNTTAAGNSTFTFSAGVSFSVGSGPLRVISPDINCDGKPDLAVSNQSGGSVSVLLNTTAIGASTPTFSAAVSLGGAGTPEYLAAGDINKDGKPDIVVANLNGGVIVFRSTTAAGASTASFAAGTSFAVNIADGLALGDINGDGRLDIVSANQNLTASVFLNTTVVNSTTISFSAKTDYTTPMGCTGVNVCDFNTDGKPDFITANGNGNSLSVFLNLTTAGSTTPGFAARKDFPLSNASSSAWATYSDFNHDGKPDFVTTGANNTGIINIYMDTTAPNSSVPYFNGLSALFVTQNSNNYGSIADFNGDGKPDIITVGNSTAEFYRNTMSIGTTNIDLDDVNGIVGNNAQSISSADFNMDGKPDIATTNDGPNSVSVILNTTTPGAGSVSFSGLTNFAASGSGFGICADDFNSDGKPDIAYNSGTKLAVMFNTVTPGASTPSFSASTEFSLANGGPSRIITADFNRDGKPDIACGYLSGVSAVSIFLNTGTPGGATPSFSAKTDIPMGPCLDLCSDDFNMDGKPDLASGNNNNAFISVALNTTTIGAAAPTFSSKVDFSTGGNVNGICCGDINNDGKPDIVSSNMPAALTANVSNGTISVFLNTTTPGASTPTFSTNTDFSAGSRPRGIRLYDINGDGKLDVIVVDQISQFCSVFMNTTTPGASTPTFGARQDFSNGLACYAASIGDFNIDGKPDIAVSNLNTTTLSVFINKSPIPLPVELSSFTSAVDKQNVTLNWSTVQEENNKGFEIERNSPGAGWKTVGYVEGNGTTHNIQNYSFSDRGLVTGHYNYRLKQIDYNGNFEYHELTSEVIIGVPAKYALAQNYPNPFNPVTRINYELPITSYVSLKIFDITGREISSLVNEVKEAGYYSVQFDAKYLSSGTYFYKITSDKFSDVKKMVVVK